MAGALFRRIAETTRAVVGRVHGEAVIIRPRGQQSGPNGPGAPDPVRQPYDDAGACFYEDSVNGDLTRSQPMLRGNGQMMHRSTGISASIRLDPGSPLRTGDRLERLDGSRWYEITEINPDGLGHAMVNLAHAKPFED